MPKCWSKIYQALNRDDSVTDLMITRSCAFTLEREAIVENFLNGKISATRAQEDLEELKLRYLEEPGCFHIH